MPDRSLLRRNGAARRAATGLALCLGWLPWMAQAQSAGPGIALIDVLRGSLKQNPNTQLQQQQVIASQGAILQAQGQFDPQLSANITRQRDLRSLRGDEIVNLEAAGIQGVNRQTTDVTTWRAGVEQILLNGVAVGGNVAVTKTDDTSAQQGQLPAQTLGRLNFTLRVPLMRNVGRDVVGAGVFAAEAENKAALYDLVQTNAQTVLNSTLAYWDYLARQRRLSIAINSEQRAGALNDEMNKLIRADQVPRAELELLLASRAEKTIARVQAEQAFVEARRTLARAIGLPADQAIAMPDPADEFPTYQGQALDGDALPDILLRSAAVRARADLEANRQREAAARYRLVAARNGLKPQVDFNLNLGYGTLAEGRGPYDLERLLYQGRVGPSFGASLGIQLPYGNSAARGALMVQSAAYDASTIRIRELEASIGNNVAVQIEALRRAALQLAEGAEAVKRYATTLINERTKRRLGQSTLIDVINVQDRFDNAHAAQVQLQQGFAIAIAQLRFELGMLVRQEGESFDVRVEDLTSIEFKPG